MRTLVNANERGLDLEWFTQPPEPEAQEAEIRAEQLAAAWNVIAVRVVGPSNLELAFGDGVTGTLDLHRHLAGPGFELLHDPDYFALARLDLQAGAVVWPGGPDLLPELLHWAVQEQQAQPPAAESPGSTTGDGGAEGS